LISLAWLFPLASVHGFSAPPTPTLVWRLPGGLLAASLCVWTIQVQKAGLMAVGLAFVLFWPYVFFMILWAAHTTQSLILKQAA
jgi:hypothetical protein